MTLVPIRTVLHGWRGRPYVLLPILLISIFMTAGCGERDDRLVVRLWHQMTPSERVVLEEEIERFTALHSEIEIRPLYKETEELRSGFQAAALAGIGPEIIYGPSDATGPFHAMRLLRDLSPWFPANEQSQFLETALIHLPAQDGSNQLALVQVGDRVGNHLALVYNRRFIRDPPKTTDDLIRLALANTLDENGDGRPDRYGIVWNFIEPFFAVPFLTGHGAWLFADSDHRRPSLNTPEMVAALQFVHSLRNRYHVIPANCDYEMADALFKDGKAAMIINGDWSWADYLAHPGIDAAVAPLPIVSATGIPMGPMVATKGYSLSMTAEPTVAQAAMEFVRYMTSVEVERRSMLRLKTLPSRRELLDDLVIQNDPTLKASYEQMTNGRPMPVAAELRAIWDAMRPHYQALLSGIATPADAAAAMQLDAENKIDQMNQDIVPGPAARAIFGLCAAAVIGLLIWQRKNGLKFVRQWRGNRLAYFFVGPSLCVIFLTIVFPFFYNVALSLSNMSLRHFQDWEIIGFQNYVEVLREPMFFSLMTKTIVWTGVNVFFHVTIGLLLAVVLNGPIRGKAIYRVFLIIPWAVPAYITALTWRGMFDYEYGAVNLLAGHYLSMSPVNWLMDPFNAFLACILTNVWLGFPFMMVIALGGMQGIPQELYEAARIDRASRTQQFFHVTLPLLKPVLLPAIALGAMWTFNNLNVIWLVSNGGEPSDKTHILVSYVYKAVFNLYRYGYGAALSMVIFFILLVFSVVLLRRTKATQSVY